MWTKAEDKTWRRAQGAPGWGAGPGGTGQVGCTSLGLREAGGPGWGAALNASSAAEKSVRSKALTLQPTEQKEASPRTAPSESLSYGIITTS